MCNRAELHLELPGEAWRFLTSFFYHSSIRKARRVFDETFNDRVEVRARLLFAAFSFVLYPATAPSWPGRILSPMQ